MENFVNRVGITGDPVSFSENEKRYLQLLCKGYPYREIARLMHVSHHSINYYFSCISEKLNTKSKAVMALEAIRLGIVSLDDERKENTEAG